MYSRSTNKARRSCGSAARSMCLTLAVAAVLIAAACGESRTLTDPAALPATPSLGKGNGGGGGCGGNGGGHTQKIVFLNGSATIRRILTVNPDGSGLDTLGGTGEFSSPTWSPDHSLIAYSVGDGGYPPI